MNIEFSKYVYVSALNTTIEEMTPATGYELHIEKIEGCAAIDTDIKVEVFWGSELLFVTHTATIQDRKIVRTTDGSTKLKIKLTNDSLHGETIGATILYALH